MCKTITLKFACKHTSPVRLSTCLGRFTKPSAKKPGKTLLLCKGEGKSYARLTRNMSWPCPKCIRKTMEVAIEQKYDIVHRATRAEFKSPDTRAKAIQARDAASDECDIELDALDAVIPAGRRKSAARKATAIKLKRRKKVQQKGAEEVQQKGGEEVQQNVGEEVKQQVESDDCFGVETQEKIARKLDVIAQWNKKHAEAVRGCTGACKRPRLGNYSCKTASAGTAPAAALAPATPAVAGPVPATPAPAALVLAAPTRPTLRLKLKALTKPKAKRGVKKRKARKLEATEPLCAKGDAARPSDAAVPRPLKKLKLINRKIVCT